MECSGVRCVDCFQRPVPQSATTAVVLLASSWFSRWVTETLWGTCTLINKAFFKETVLVEKVPFQSFWSTLLANFVEGSTFWLRDTYKNLSACACACNNLETPWTSSSNDWWHDRHRHGTGTFSARHEKIAWPYLLQYRTYYWLSTEVRCVNKRWLGYQKIPGFKTWKMRTIASFQLSVPAVDSYAIIFHKKGVIHYFNKI